MLTMRIYDARRASQGADSPRTFGGNNRVSVGIAEYAVTADGEVLSTSGLGSCVGVALYDSAVPVSGLVHVMLPSVEDAGSETTNRARYADSGIEMLVDDMIEAGANQDRILAKCAGGSDMLGFSNAKGAIGSRNVEAVIDTLDRLGIPIVAQDVGGEFGRSLELDSHTGELSIRTAHGDEVII